MKIGFIGTGNMASAIMGGAIKKGVVTPEDMIGADVSAPGREKVRTQFGIQVTADNKEVVQNADVVFLSVKPQFYGEVISGIKDEFRREQIIITIAPGKTLAWLKEQFGRDVKLVRCMPNTPALVGEGMTAACPNELISDEDLDTVKKILGSFSYVEIVPERLMDTVTAVSGSSPAFVFLFIEAMADSAVCCGMPREQAYKFAAQAVLGSAKMVMETGKHPGELKDMVCSPAGTTIGGVRVLEQAGFRSAVFEAVKEAEEISRSL
ncbi:MAG: pyrroline-5-carboxylate reductase [Dorea sp.]|nr:pyrroline-5-carboxylate reductase [Dorea sp.]